MNGASQPTPQNWSQDSSTRNRLLFIAGLLVLTLIQRVVAAESEWLGNTSPLMAICFGGGLLLGQRFWWVPACLLLLTDLSLGLAHGHGVGAHTFFTIAFFSLVAFAASRWQNRARWFTLLGGTLTCSLLFYLAANTFAWAGSPAYAKSFAGWWQSQSTGLPGYPPSWTFLRNALIADSFWCLAAAPLFFWDRVKAPEPLPVSENPAGDPLESQA